MTAICMSARRVCGPRTPGSYIRSHQPRLAPAKFCRHAPREGGMAPLTAEAPPRWSGFRWHASARDAAHRGCRPPREAIPTFVCDLACSMVRQVCASPRERPAWATSHTSARASGTGRNRPRLRRVIFVLAGCAQEAPHHYCGILWAPEIAPVQRRRSSCTCLANLSTRRRLSASKAPQDPPL